MQRAQDRYAYFYWPASQKMLRFGEVNPKAVFLCKVSKSIPLLPAAIVMQPNGC